MLLRLILGGHNSKVRFQQLRRSIGRRKEGGGIISRIEARGTDSSRPGTIKRKSARDESDGVAGGRAS
jgi:hypothetical protein